MHEIFHNLPPGAKVLDLGAGGGSFDGSGYSFVTIRCDLEKPGSTPANFVQADAAGLPFADRSFDAVICNHSVEHFPRLRESLSEMGRVLKKVGAVYISVPCGATITDMLYRWLARGGGHVNYFRSPSDVIAPVEDATGLHHVATRSLCTSLSFLNPANRTVRAPRRALLLLGGAEPVLLALNWLFRLWDRLFATRSMLYGWAFYFGKIEEQISGAPWSNVCVRCGAGYPSDWIVTSGRVERSLLLDFYTCPKCGARNLLSLDEHYVHLV